MLTGIIKGVRAVKSADIGKEIALAVIAGAVSWYVSEKLKQWQQNKQKR